MKTRPPGTLGVARRLARLSIRRRLNRFAARRQKRRKGRERDAVGRKRSGSLMPLVLFGGLMIVQAFLLSYTVIRLHSQRIEVRGEATEAAEAAMGHAETVVEAGEREELIGLGGGGGSEKLTEEQRRQIREAEQMLRAYRAPDWPAPERLGTLLASLSLVLTGMFFALFFLHLSTGNPDLGQAGWDVEWLFTFPVPSRGLFLAKVGEFVLADLIGWAVFPAFLIVFLWKAGYGAWGIPLGLLGALGLISVLASLRLVAETWLRKRLSRSALKNVQAIATVLGMLLFFSVFLLGMQPPEGLFRLAERIPAVFTALPWTAPLRLATSPLAFLLVAGWALLTVMGALALASRLVRDGLLVSGGSAYGGVRRVSKTRSARRGRLRGIAGKEIRLLLRDRNLMVQMLVVPLLIIGFQLLANPQFRSAGTSPTTAVVIAFAVGAYVLMFGAFAVLFVERDALWLLFTLPHRLGLLLRRKVVLWASVSIVYALGALALAWRPSGDMGFEDALRPLFALLALPVLASIAAGLGTLGTDPFEQDVRRRVAPQWVYLYTLLAAGYGYALAAQGLWSTFVLLVLLAALAWAIWQKADERLPVLLDPVVRPIRRLSLPDGLIAVLCFFVLQGVFVLPLLAWMPPLVAVLLAYVLAGLVVAVGARISFAGSPALGEILASMGLGRSPTPRALGLGVVAGLCAAAVGAGWLAIVEAWPWLRDLKDAAPVMTADTGDARWAVVALAVLAAPLFEEYLFRGLLLGGMLRTASARIAVPACALIFAVVHPPLSFPPVFALGVAAGIVFVKTRLLWASVLAHAVYNAVIVAISA